MLDASTAPPFVGRREELAWLEFRLADAIRGRPQLALLPGDPGIGKTRLLKELGAIARLSDVRVQYGRAYQDLPLPYLPFEPLLREVAAQASAAPSELRDHAEEIQRILGRRSSLTPEGETATGRPRADHDRARLLVAMSQSLILLTRRAPCLLILDDLHWFDPASLQLVSHLVFSVADAAEQESIRLMLVLSYRQVAPETPVGRAAARFGREAICQRLELGGFQEPDVRDLVGSIGLERASNQLVGTISHATGGNPLFIQEVVRQLGEGAKLEERSGYLVTSLAAEDLQLPVDVTGAIAAHVRELGEASRQALTLAAFLGEQFALDDLAALVGEPEGALLTLLEEGIRERLVVGREREFEFAHPLIRHVLYNGPSPARRQRIHERVARRLEASSDPDSRVFEIAHHLIRAGSLADVTKTGVYARRAGERARELFAWDEGARFFEAAARAAARSDRVSRRELADLHYRAGLTYSRAMDAGPALDHVEQAVAVYREADDVRGMAHALVQQTRVRITLASVAYGTLVDVKPLEEVLGALGDEEPALRSEILVAIASVLWTAREPKQAAEAAQQALGLARSIDDPILCAQACGPLALCQMQTLAIREALATSRRGREEAQRAGDLWLEGQRLVRTPLALICLGRLREAEGVAEEACALTQQTHNWGEHSMALANLALLAVLKGNFDSAERHARETLRMIERTGYPWAGPMVLQAVACARHLRGLPDEAEDAMEILQEPGRVFTTPGKAYQSRARLYRELLRAHEEDREEKDGAPPSRFLRGGSTAEPELGSLERLCAQVEVAALRNDPDAAELPYRALSKAAEQGVVFSTGWISLIPRVLGVAATLREAWDEAESHFQRALKLANEEGARPEAGRCHLDYARMCLARSGGADRAKALEHLRVAREAFRDVGMDRYRGQTEKLARDLGAEPATVDPEPAGAALSLRESDLLGRVARGEGEESIARELVLRGTTVSRRLDQILAKLGADDPRVALAYAREHGLLAGSTRPMQADIAEPRPEAAHSTRIVCFTDLVRSTELLQRFGDEAVREVLRTHEALIRDCLARHRGALVQYTGDGFLLSFRSAADGIACAIEIQRATAAYNAEASGAPLGLKIGMTAGDPIAERDRLVGVAVHAAARICAHATGAQILVSEGVRELAGDEDFRFAELGPTALKGFDEPFRLYQVEWEGEKK
jgi:class 3 adenylate cyclase/tetratricopeptide (TPR) repeat protein